MPETCSTLACCPPSPFAYEAEDIPEIVLELIADPPDGGTLTGGGGYSIGDSAVAEATPAVPTVIDTAVDMVFVADGSSVLADVRAIIQSLALSLDQDLRDRGVGAGEVENRYAVVWFGFGQPAEMDVNFSNAEDFAAAAPGIAPSGGGPLNEDAYEGINFAIESMVWRDAPTVSKIIFFITDEDRQETFDGSGLYIYNDGADQAAQFASLKAKLVAGGFILAGMFGDAAGTSGGDDLKMKDGSGNVLIGCDYTLNLVTEGDDSLTSPDGRSYIANGTGGYTESTGLDTISPDWIQDNPGFPDIGQQAEYFNLVMDKDVAGYYFSYWRYLEGGNMATSVLGLVAPVIAGRVAQELAYTFTGWYDELGNLESAANPYTLTLNNNRRLTAMFTHS